MDSLEQLKQYHQSLKTQSNGQYGILVPCDVDSWFAKFQETHNAIRNKIGAVCADIDLQLDISGLSIIRNPTFVAIRQYLQEFASTKQYFAHHKIANVATFLSNPYAHVGKRKINVIRSISTYVKDKNDPNINKIGDHLTQLRDLWAVHNKKVNLAVFARLSTSSVDFAKIGNTSTELSSCFSHASHHNTRMKYVFGLVPHSFVVFAGKDKETVDNGQTELRCLGYCNDDLSCANYLSPYYAGRIHRDLIQLICEQLTIRIFGIVNPILTQDRCSITGQMYTHGPFLSFAKTAVSGTQKVEAKTEVICNDL